MRQSEKTGILVLGGLAAVMTPAILLAAGGSTGGFNSVVDGIESRYHAHATRIPFMGLISGIARISTHGGVHNLHVAEFDNFPSGGVDGDELKALVEQRAGQGWQQMIRETSRHGGEQTLIYVRPEGHQVGMMVVDLDGRELDLVQLSMKPEELVKEVTEHSKHPRNWTNSDSDGKHDDATSESAGPSPDATAKVESRAE
jgi:hypothetical protein